MGVQVPDLQQSQNQFSHAQPSAEGQESSGMSFAPPPFQLKTSSLSNLAHQPGAVSSTTEDAVQMKSLNEYSDTDPQHDPSLISDGDIKATEEYKAMLNLYHLVPTTDPSTLYTPEEILLACRLMIRHMREMKVCLLDPVSQAPTYLQRARSQAGTAEQAESMEGDLSWNPTFPGKSNTDFGKWLLDGGPEPDPSTGIMNCWELVMWSAFKAGFASKQTLASMYLNFATDLKGGDINGSIANFENALKQGEEYQYDANNPDSPKPLRGDVVIFNNLGAHVAVATGNTTSTGTVEIISLWTQNSKNVFKTSIENLMNNHNASGPIRFFSPSW